MKQTPKPEPDPLRCTGCPDYASGIPEVYVEFFEADGYHCDGSCWCGLTHDFDTPENSDAMVVTFPEE